MSSTKRWRGWFKLPYTGNGTATMATVGSSSLSLVSSAGRKGACEPFRS
jgi:hypothetical protein